MNRIGFISVRFLMATGSLSVASILGVATHQVLQSREIAGRSREQIARLEGERDALQREHEALRERYDATVRRTAVTELLVENNRLDVLIRTAEGELKRIPTIFDPRAEIYVDFVVLDGRIWIRRIFDSVTPPESGLVIDPLVESVDWDQRPEGFGKAIYRSLTPGRWVVSVTGNGSLGLTRAADSIPVDLTNRPAIRDSAPN